VVWQLSVGVHAWWGRLFVLGASQSQVPDRCGAAMMFCRPGWSCQRWPATDTGIAHRLGDECPVIPGVQTHSKFPTTLRRTSTPASIARTFKPLHVFSQLPFRSPPGPSRKRWITLSECHFPLPPSPPPLSLPARAQSELNPTARAQRNRKTTTTTHPRRDDPDRVSKPRC